MVCPTSLPKQEHAHARSEIHSPSNLGLYHLHVHRPDAITLRTLPAIAAIAALSLLMGCGSSGSESSASTSTTAAGSSTTKPAAPTTTLSPTLCATAQLQASLGQTEAAAGQIYVPIVFVNTGTKPCELRGFPGVSLLGPDGTQIGQPATRNGAEGASVTLASNGTASALLRTANSTGGTSNCTAAASTIRVYPPDNTGALFISSTFSACGGMSIGTVVAGPTGN